MGLFGNKNAPKPPLKASKLEQYLNAAKPAENREESFYPEVAADMAANSSSEYQNLAVLDETDGVWVCCCGNETPLVHYLGKFPFKHLTCGKCEKVICEKCVTTEILELQRGPLEIGEVVRPGWEVRICYSCAACGLTHRGVVYNEQMIAPDQCCCGDLCGPGWLMYRIGPPDGYWHNPAKTAHRVKERWRRHKMKRSLHLLDEEERVKAHREERRRKNGEVERGPTAYERYVESWKQANAHSTSSYQHDFSAQRAHSTGSMWPTEQPLDDREAYTPPPARRLTAVNPDTNDEVHSLQRSHAQRGKRPANLQRVVTLNNLATQSPSRSDNLLRAETWVSGDEHRHIDETAKTFVRSAFGGTVTYNLVKNTTGGEIVMECVREDVYKDVLASRSAVASPDELATSQTENMYAYSKMVRPDTPFRVSTPPDEPAYQLAYNEWGGEEKDPDRERIAEDFARAQIYLKMTKDLG
ncbi:hypothetical protein N0V94_002759 [Neodidymelliopsis sp. IMI 364377]|nr:hypothetical protein N0V94_002759 [Neodidymelliopsis sp. IMI 364377]